MSMEQREAPAMGHDDQLQFYAYVSRAKVQQLHDQLNEISAREISRKKAISGSGTASVEAGGLLGFLKGSLIGTGARSWEIVETGNKSPVQMLKDVIEKIDAHETVYDLNELCTAQRGQKLDAFAYLYEGSFGVHTNYPRQAEPIEGSGEAPYPRGDAEERALMAVARAEYAFAETGPNQGKIVSDICLIRSQCNGFTIQLACSLKYFADMGGSWNEEKGEWSVGPHSGNYDFFEGGSQYWFKGLIFITSVKDKVIMATPLFLVQRADPEAVI
jgi:hypothetical protein